jgi:hypothetical protein
MIFQARSRQVEAFEREDNDETSSTAMRAGADRAPSEDSQILRDSLVFHLGALAQLLLTTALRDRDCLRRYRGWLSGASDSSGDDEDRLDISRVGLEAGEVLLEARAVADEFLLGVAHDEFSAVLSLAFCVSTRRVLGLHLVHSDGKAFGAIRWLQALTSVLTERQPHRSVARVNN